MVSAGRLDSSACSSSSSSRKCVLAMPLAVGGGGREGSDEKEAREGEGDMLFEVDRRGGATPLADCSEFMEAFRKRVGVAERESRLLALAPKDMREEDRALSAEGDRSTAGLYELLGERAGAGGVDADGEVESDSPWRDCSSCPSDSLAWLEETLRAAGVAV